MLIVRTESVSHLFILQPFDTRERIPRLVPDLLGRLLVFNTPDNILDLFDHPERSFIFFSRRIRVLRHRSGHSDVIEP
jgi:hypothetical protein